VPRQRSENDPGTRWLRPEFKNSISGLASAQQTTEATSQQQQQQATECEMEEEDPHKSDLVILRVQRLLLPSLLEEILQNDL
jgi:hypothetical protein